MMIKNIFLLFMEKSIIENNIISLMQGNISMASKKIEMYSLHETSKYKTNNINQAVNNAKLE